MKLEVAFSINSVSLCAYHWLVSCNFLTAISSEMQFFRNSIFIRQTPREREDRRRDHTEHVSQSFTIIIIVIKRYKVAKSGSIFVSGAPTSHRNSYRRDEPIQRQGVNETEKLESCQPKNGRQAKRVETKFQAERERESCSKNNKVVESSAPVRALRDVIHF